MKKLVCLLVCLCMTFSLVPFAAMAETNSDPLVFWDLPWGDSTYVEAAQALVARYTEETGVPVVYQQIPWDGWVQTYITAVTSNAGPDVTTGGAFLQHRLAAMGEVASLDDLVATYSEDDFVPGTLNNFKYNGTQIAIPYNSDFRCIYYRTDMFEEAGITDLPTNWDEFYEDAKILTHDDQYGYVLCTADASGAWNGVFWTLANGGWYLNENMEADMVNPNDIEALDFLDKMYNEGIIPPGAASYTQADAQKMFYSGKAAMIVEAIGMAPQIPEEIRDKVSILPVMESPEGLKQEASSVNGIMLLEDSQKKEEGKAFIDWWSKNSITLWTVGGMGPFPARLSLLQDDYFQNEKFNKLITDLVVPNSRLITYPFSEAHVEMDIMDGEQFYRSILQELFTTDRTSEEVLTNANQRFQKALDQLHDAE